MLLLALPPTIDYSPEFCFCGRKTVESHEFWFCSTECAHLDSLRSLGDPNCHYRNVVRDAYVRAGAPELQPRRMMSAVHLRADPSEQRGFANAPTHFLPPTNLPHQSNVALARGAARAQNVVGFPTLSGEPPVAERHDRSRRQGFQKPPSSAHPAPRPGDHTFEQISLDAIPFPEHVPKRSLRRVPSSIDGIRKNTKKSPVAALLNFGRFRKGKEVENPERVFGHPVNAIVAPVRKDPQRMGRAL
jgi:hypothetical protein